MKIVLTLSFLLLGSISFSQKANDDALSCKHRHLRYPQRVELSANVWALNIVEHPSCQGLVLSLNREATRMDIERRAVFYLGQIPSQAKFFSQSSQNVASMTNAKTPFIHFEMETRDISLRTQDVKKAQSGTTFTFLIAVHVPIELRATHKGDMVASLLDTNNTTAKLRYFTFPGDAQLGTAPDIKPNGYPTEAELQAAWRKYGKTAEMQWRDKVISEFMYPILWDFKQTFIQFEDWNTFKVYSDKNKKGGFDHIVQAAELFHNTIAEIDADYETGSTMKFYTEEYQARFKQSLEIWKTFLAEFDNDVIEKDENVSAEYRQKILLNYLHALVFTAQFDEAQAQIDLYLKQDVRSGTRFDLEQIGRLNTQLKTEYTAHAQRLGWKK